MGEIRVDKRTYSGKLFEVVYLYYDNCSNEITSIDEKDFKKSIFI